MRQHLWMLVPAGFVLLILGMLQGLMGAFWPKIDQEFNYTRKLQIDVTTKIWYKTEIVYYETAYNITVDSMLKERQKAEYIIKNIILK